MTDRVKPVAVGAPITAVHFLGDLAAFVCAEEKIALAAADGEVSRTDVHGGAILCAASDGKRIVTGGDDGKVVWSRIEGGEIVASLIAEVKNKWVEHVATSAASGLIAFTAGKEVHVRDAADPAFTRTFTHEKTVSGLAFEPKGRRLASATYGGCYLWYARIADQKPVMLKWAGSHVALTWSPDGKFLVSAMQENQLHGWRVADEKNMRMGGYPAKVKSLVFLSKGQLMATSGASGAVVWPFAGATGPMGKQAAEVGYDEAAMVVHVAAAPQLGLLAAGLDDGRVWAADVTGERLVPIKSEKGPAITALALSADARRVAWGDEEGGAGVGEID